MVGCVLISSSSQHCKVVISFTHPNATHIHVWFRWHIILNIVNFYISIWISGFSSQSENWIHPDQAFLISQWAAAESWWPPWCRPVLRPFAQSPPLPVTIRSLRFRSHKHSTWRLSALRKIDPGSAVGITNNSDTLLGEFSEHFL